MNQQEYSKRVLETESKPETINATVVSLDMILAIGIAAGEVMNRAKRAIFYGKPLEVGEISTALQELAESSLAFNGVVLHNLFGSAEFEKHITSQERNAPIFATASLNHVNKRLLHGAIGEMSETAEKLEALRKQLLTGEFDLVNYAEEVGDSEWYSAIQKDELQQIAYGAAVDELAERSGTEDAPVVTAFDASEEAIRARNIAKLEKRNKGRTFNAEATVNRDTDAERIILEDAAPVPASSPVAQSVALEQAA